MSARQARPSGDPPLDPPERLRSLPSWLFAQLAARGNRLVGERLDDGASRSEFAVLAALAESGPCSQMEIVRRLAIDRADLSVLLDRLDDAGLTRRTPDPQDRRRKLVSITPAGRARLRALEPAIVAAQDDLLAPLDAAERAALLSALRRLLGVDRPQRPIYAARRSSAARTSSS